MSEPKNYEWRVITDNSALVDLKDEWERLFLSNPRHSPFLAWGWVAAWLHHLAGPHNLEIITLWNESEELQLAIPLSNNGSTKTFSSAITTNIGGYGPECSDYLGFLRLPKYEDNLAELVSVAIHKMLPPNRRVQLASLDSAGQFPARLGDQVSLNNRRVRVTVSNVCPAVELPSSWEEFTQKLSRNFRSQVQRQYRKILKNDDTTFRSVDKDDSEDFASQLIHLNRMRMDSTGTESSLEDENFRSFLTEAIQYMAAKDLVWMDTIQQDGKTVGAALNMTHGKNVYYYMGGFDMEATKLAPGNVLFVHVINRAIENSYTKFDFLRGAENYKYRWGAADTELHSLEIYPKGFFGGQVAWATESAYQTAKKRLRNLRMRKKSE